MVQNFLKPQMLQKTLKQCFLVDNFDRLQKLLVLHRVKGAAKRKVTS